MGPKTLCNCEREPQKSRKSDQRQFSRIEYLLKHGKCQPMLNEEDEVDTISYLEHTQENTNVDDTNVNFEAAKEFFRRNFFSIFVCMLTGLYTLMFIPSISRLLFYTKKSDNPIKAFSRYLDTLNHTIQWYMSPKERTKSLKTVRKLHTMALKQTLRKIEDEDCVVTDQGAVPMSQFDLVLTQWAFIGAALIRSKDIGLRDVTQAELRYLTNQMYQVGRELGIANKFNLCSGNLEDIIEYAKDIESFVIRPALESEKEFESMSKHLMKGVNVLNPFIDPDAFSTWTHKLFGAKRSYQRRVENLRSYKSRVLYFLLIFLFKYVLNIKPIRWFAVFPLNTLMDLNIYMANILRQQITKDYYPNHLPLPLHLWIYGILSYVKFQFLEMFQGLIK